MAKRRSRVSSPRRKTAALSASKPALPEAGPATVTPSEFGHPLPMVTSFRWTMTIQRGDEVYPSSYFSRVEVNRAKKTLAVAILESADPQGCIHEALALFDRYNPTVVLTHYDGAGVAIMEEMFHYAFLEDACSVYDYATDASSLMTMTLSYNHLTHRILPAA